MNLYQIDGVTVNNVPDGINWDPPRHLGDDGDGAPSYAPYWTARLSFARTSVVQLQHWHDAMDGQTHTVRLPHPISGTFTDFTNVYVRLPTASFNARDSDRIAAAGVDIVVKNVSIS